MADEPKETRRMVFMYSFVTADEKTGYKWGLLPLDWKDKDDCPDFDNAAETIIWQTAHKITKGARPGMVFEFDFSGEVGAANRRIHFYTKGRAPYITSILNRDMVQEWYARVAQCDAKLRVISRVKKAGAKSEAFADFQAFKDRYRRAVGATRAQMLADLVQFLHS